MILRLALLALMLAGSAGAQPVPEPDGFRGEPYRAPVPETLQGAVVIGAAQAVALHKQGVPRTPVHPRASARCPRWGGSRPDRSRSDSGKFTGSDSATAQRMRQARHARIDGVAACVNNSRFPAGYVAQPVRAQHS